MSWRAVIFDCDGVLVDSEPQANRTLSEVLGEHGVRMTPEECRAAFVGLNPTGVAKKLLELKGVDLRATLPGETVPRFMALLEREGVAAVPGAAEAVEMCRARGLAVAVASNSPLAELALKLRLSGIGPLVGEHFYSGDALGRSKPDPGVYLHAAARLGVAPGACAVIEDSATGVKAGVAAGMRVLGFTGTHDGAHSAEVLLNAGAERTYHSHAQLEKLLG